MLQSELDDMGPTTSRTALGRYLPRHASADVRTALTDTRIVALVGPRQSGKTTLLRRIAREANLPFATLDDHLSREFAADDPTGFLRTLPRAAIDEVQRAPDLMLALKRTVDENPRPGRYLVAGSVDLFARSISPDSLAGRVETVTLMPFSQAEIAGLGIPTFLERAFSADFPSLAEVGRTRDLVGRVLSGGDPEAIARPVGKRRRAWLRAYADALSRRDVAREFRVSAGTECPAPFGASERPHWTTLHSGLDDA